MAKLDFSKIAAVALVSLAVTGGPLLARGVDNERNLKFSDPHVRFPGDTSFKEGTIRTRGPAKGPYVERCRWVMNPSFGKGFGLTQICYRHTLENTK